MDVMRKAIYMLSVLCVAALWGGCQRGGGEETAQVTLRFNTRAGSALTDENAEEGEGMKDLQIVLYRRVNGVYTYYKKYDHEVPEGETGSTTVDLGDVQLGDYLFYVVANGASAGLTVGEGGMREDALKGYVMKSGTFPAAAVPQTGLPMAGFERVIVNQERVTKEIKVVRAVARLDIELENASGSAMTVQSINLGAFVANQAYLFGGTGHEVPANVEYSNKNMPVNRDISDGGTSTFSFYLYPSEAEAGKYTLGLTANINNTNKTYTPQPLKDARNGNDLTAMPRNTLYRIHAIVDVDAITFRGITVDGWETSYSGGDINIGNND